MKEGYTCATCKEFKDAEQFRTQRRGNKTFTTDKPCKDCVTARRVETMRENKRREELRTGFGSPEALMVKSVKLRKEGYASFHLRRIADLMDALVEWDKGLFADATSCRQTCRPCARSDATARA